jgi:hypothetical protein
MAPGEPIWWLGTASQTCDAGDARCSHPGC